MRKVGILKELKSTEGRVMLTPEGVKVLTRNGIEVLVEQNAGEDCGFDDIRYERAGAVILPTMEKIMDRAQLLLQVSPPLPIEFELLNESHTLISLYNMLSFKHERFQNLLETRATIFGAELIQNEEGQYPLLIGMSEIAGNLAIYKVAQLLTVEGGGKGKLLSGTSLSKPARITIVGTGRVGRTAARTALNNGAEVNLFSLKEEKLEGLKSEFPDALVEFYSEDKLREAMPESDALVICVYSLKKQYEITISRETVGLMEEGSVVVDVSINQSEVLETSHLTNFEQPTFSIDGILHYCVPNISAAVPVTGSRVITKKILPYIKSLALTDLKHTLVEHPGLLSALCIYKGKVTHRNFSDRFGQEFYNIFELLELNL